MAQLRIAASKVSSFGSRTICSACCQTPEAAHAAQVDVHVITLACKVWWKISRSRSNASVPPSILWSSKVTKTNKTCKRYSCRTDALIFWSVVKLSLQNWELHGRNSMAVWFRLSDCCLGHGPGRSPFSQRGKTYKVTGNVQDCHCMETRTATALGRTAGGRNAGGLLSPLPCESWKKELCLSKCLHRSDSGGKTWLFWISFCYHFAHYLSISQGSCSGTRHPSGHQGTRHVSIYIFVVVVVQT